MLHLAPPVSLGSEEETEVVQNGNAKLLVVEVAAVELEEANKEIRQEQGPVFRVLFCVLEKCDNEDRENERRNSSMIHFGKISCLQISFEKEAEVLELRVLLAGFGDDFETFETFRVLEGNVHKEL